MTNNNWNLLQKKKRIILFFIRNQQVARMDRIIIKGKTIP
jgi:hypothetical protein